MYNSVLVAQNRFLKFIIPISTFHLSERFVPISLFFFHKIWGLHTDFSQPCWSAGIDFSISSKRKCHQIVTPFRFSFRPNRENGRGALFKDRWTPHPSPGDLFIKHFFCGRKRFSFLEGLKIDGKKEATLFSIPSFLSHGENY